MAGLALASIFAVQAARCDSLEPRPAEITLLSYNVHGLFRLAAEDSPRNRMPTIGWLANKYDVVLLQEDFEFPDVIEQQMQRARRYEGNGIGDDPVLMLIKILSLPLTLPIPRFSPPYGSGLSTYVPNGMAVPGATLRRAYNRCAGWFSSQNDCWARKGYLMVRLRAPNGVEVDIYNTHIEAGSGRRSLNSRRRNFDTLAQGVEKFSSGRAVVIAGDFNVDYSDPGDREILTEFRSRLGLMDSSAGPKLAVWRERDFILSRSGNGATITIEDAGEATEFVSGNRALSDHPALYVRLRLSARSTP
jgi:endonuclease/exonuclease/phosphatase family metal-dependent hydrolase